MKCKCGFPLSPPNILIRQGLFIDKEIPNNYVGRCLKCGAEYSLTGYKGKATLRKINK